ncbi:response regulator [Methylomicrobium sp. RS1]|jgi:CheY-like chemotaxis protein|uniref:response regulator n=1 Tax=Candidatus Methylomicrobium oryzae TaxID=2802053 RepID=UPI001920CBE0|nr:response regulator receiver protein [Methylomicrobium sp. RS1]MBL1263228.1 response regulator receiver protein [Methylomicrobium sp. RS1]
MFFKHWPVLLVDDEPDVLAISRLAMKNFEVYGLPLKIYTARSKQEALWLINDDVEVGCSLAVALLDVVMETERAGLELCDYIRNSLGNKLTQIYIRTGQPGIAPEREVIDRYEINGYFTKVEATEDKLYSLIKSSIRQYLAYGMALATVELANNLTEAAGSRRQLLYALSPIGGLSPEQAETPRWLIIDGEVLFADEIDAGRGLQLLARLGGLEGMPLNPAGDRYVRDSQGYWLIEVRGGARQAQVAFLFKSRFAPPELIVSLMHGFVKQLAVLWRQSRADVLAY